MQKIEAHNKKKNETFKQGECEHSDMSYEEKRVKRMGLKVPEKKKSKRSLPDASRFKRNDESLPASVDYR